MKSKYSIAAALILVLAGVYFFYSTKSEEKTQATSASAETPLPTQAPQHFPGEEVGVDLNNLTAHIKDPKGFDNPPIQLTSDNFENLLHDCEEWHPCEFSESPWNIYQHFKRSKNKKAINSLIEYLSNFKLSNPNEREKYREVVRRMIDDFFGPEEKPYQEARYAMQVGEHEKALKLFKELNNPVYDLNLANIYYDLKRYDEALTYYHKVREELIVEEKDPNKNPALDYVEGRIDDINKRIK